jgi:hypothetical protein
LIVRVLRASVKPGRVGHFNALMRQQLPILKDHSGLVYVKLARRLEPDGGEEVILFEEWRDATSLYGWAGDDISRPRLLPGSEDLLLDLSVTHYESLDVVPSDFDVPEADDADRVTTPRSAPG